MTELFLPWILSNLITATVLASLAWCVQRSGRSNLLAHFFWTLVLVKLVTPPLFTFQWIPVETVSNSTVVASNEINVEYSYHGHHEVDFDIRAESHDKSELATPLIIDPQPKSEDVNQYSITALSFRGLIGIGLAGSLIMASLATFRILRFHRLLAKSSSKASVELEKLANKVCDEFGLSNRPTIHVTSAQVSPFVWWLGGRPSIVVSTETVERLQNEELRMVLAHEVAHLYRRDHWVRWLECLATVLFWWNPIIWIARRQLRVTEELACDELVIEKTNASVHVYANSLLSVAELLSTSAIRPPSVASAMTSGGVLEKRLKMIIRNQKIGFSLALRGMLLILACLVFPLGFVYGQDLDAVKKRLNRAVESKEITQAQANFMLEALELSMKMKNSKYDPEKKKAFSKQAYSQLEKQDRELAEKKKKYEQIVRELKEAVERGKIAANVAEEKAQAIRKDLFEQKSLYQYKIKKSHENLAEHQNRYSQAAKEIMEAVQKGKLSKKDAEKKLAAIKKDLYAQSADYDAKYQKEKKDLQAQEDRMKQVYQEIEKAVVQGKLSKEDARKKLRAIQDELNSDRKKKQRDAYEHERREADKQRELRNRKEKISAAAEEIKQAVRSGKLSERDAELKLREMEKSLFESAYKERREKGIKEKEAQLKAFIMDLEAARKKGVIGREDAKKKTEDARRKLFGDKVTGTKIRDQKESQKAKLMADLEKRLHMAAQDIEKAVKDGKLSKADAKEKLEAIKREVMEYSKKVQQERDNRDRELKDLESRKKKFEQALLEYESAVQQGKISKEEAREKAEYLRRAFEKDYSKNKRK